MKIGIVGAGNIGQALARLASTKGHAVMLSNSRGPETLAETAASIGCEAGASHDAIGFGDVVVVTIPFAKVFSVEPEPMAGKVLIDTNNYYPDRDGRIAALDERKKTTSQMVAEHFSGARVVKAFNAILAADLANPGNVPLTAGSGRRALPIAGNDVASKRVVADLHEQFGFDTVDTGGLQESWRFERAKPAYCIPLGRARLIDALGRAQRDVELPHGSWWR
ncbi:NADP oxidoreductase [Mesorhizobium sp. Root554]|uniref:NADPH-dependent F420 reductase n=1 Tax=unclassified Mesorhizobium TaxID=325217 RepID=UPI0006F869A2|nr:MULTISPECIES: NADPH-dependent F420 reductase [unclassified Mesorhizobium]KQZ15874.1 NADP oxidoreductase [Mesorhizobium sp. Root1471]KQZ38383.1 NADP oxidoreductase [Mesorhizobium sp. Root554]